MYGFGRMRVEDDVVVTDTGKRILGKRRIPYTVEQIENIMAK